MRVGLLCGRVGPCHSIGRATRSQSYTRGKKLTAGTGECCVEPRHRSPDFTRAGHLRFYCGRVSVTSQPHHHTVVVVVRGVFNAPSSSSSTTLSYYHTTSL